MSAEELESLHWATLKKMVEDAAGTYENKPQAIAFLSNVQPTLEGVHHVALVAKAPATLDKSKDFGQVFGEVEGFPAAAFHQGGAYFNTIGVKL